MINCKEVTEKSSDYVDGSLPLKARLAVWLHILICVHCRRYVQQIRTTAATLAKMGQKSEQSVQADKIEQLLSAMAEAKREKNPDN